MTSSLILVAIILAILVFGFMYFDYRKLMKRLNSEKEINLQHLKKGLQDAQDFKPIVDLNDAVEYNNNRRK